jgi:hypothetical protein
MLISLLGAALLLTPVIMAINDGVRSDDDLQSWLIGLPFEKILKIRGAVISGLGLLIAGGAMNYLPN